MREKLWYNCKQARTQPHNVESLDRASSGVSVYSRERAVAGKLVYPRHEKDPGAARRNRLKESGACVALKSKLELAGSPPLLGKEYRDTH
jgi:hypothetical protein